MGRLGSMKVAVATVVLIAAMPAVASATTASIQGDTIRIEDLEGENDNITISASGTGADGVGWRITNVDPGPGCQSSGGGALCQDGRFRNSGAGPTRSFSISLGEGDDELDYGVSESSSGDAPTGSIDLGGDDDELDSSATSTHTVLGGAGVDVLVLTGFAPSSSGTPGSGEAPDPVTLDGGEGDDLLDASGRRTGDSLIGGAGFDTVSYLERSATTPVRVTLDNVANDGRQSPAELDDVRDDVEQLVGTPGADTLIGNSNPQSIDGGPGVDSLDGAGGVDFLSFASRASSITADLGTRTTSDGDTPLNGFENLRGGGGSDQLLGDDGANRIEGGAGDDNLDGRLGVDELIGQAGTRDLAGYRSRPGPVTASLDGNRANDPDTDLYDDIEGLEGTEAGDVLRGGSGADKLFGLGGDDALSGGPGNDRDELDGGPGTEDLADYGARPDTGFLITILNTDDGEDDLNGVENVAGGQGPDVIYGDGAANQLDGGPGNDTVRGGLGPDDLAGGAGIDILSYNDAARTGGVTVSLDNVANDADGDTFGGFEQLQGSAAADTLLGGNGADNIDGGPGSDHIRGGLGSDVLFGNSGNDRLDGGPGTDPDELFGDPLDADTADYSERTVPIRVTLLEGDGAATTVDGDRLVHIRNVLGGTAADRLVGNSRDNVLRGLGGADRIDGRGGNDLLLGDAGNDIIGPLRLKSTTVCTFESVGTGAPRLVCRVRHFRANPTPDGSDTVRGDSGADLLSTVDGAADPLVSCGAGVDDAEVDLLDPRPSSTFCERIAVGARDQHPLDRVLTERARVTAGGRLELRVACPRAGPRGCRGTVKLRRGDKTLATKRYRVPRRRVRTVTVRIRGPVLRRVRRGSVLTVRTLTSERDAQDRPITTRGKVRLRRAR